MRNQPAIFDRSRRVVLFGLICLPPHELRAARDEVTRALDLTKLTKSQREHLYWVENALTDALREREREDALRASVDALTQS